MDILKKLENKDLAFLGLGIENVALLKYIFKKKINCNITVCDARPDLTNNPNFNFLKNKKKVNWKTGKNYDKNLENYDIIFRSPGFPLFNPNLVCAEKRGVEISSPMKLFFDTCPAKNIIGVTGTKGKGTTSSLIYHILKKAGTRVFSGGNIGVAPFNFFEKIKTNDWVVLELSSFQLENLHKSPKIAVFTNFYKEHLKPTDPNNPN